MATLIQDKVIGGRIAECNWVWDIRNDFAHLSASSPEDIPRAQRLSKNVVEGCLAKIRANLG